MLDDEKAQIYVGALEKHRKPLYMGILLASFKRTGLLDDDQAQIYLDALAKYPDVEKLGDHIERLSDEQAKDFLRESLKDYIIDVKQGRDVTHSYKQALAEREDESEDMHHLSKGSGNPK